MRNMNRAVVTRVLWSALLLSVVLKGSAEAEQYPVLFVHGFCSSSRAWTDMFDNLPRGRFGEDMTRLYQGADGQVRVRERPSLRELRSFTIDFHDPADGSFDARSVAQISVVDKVGQLKAVIDAIKAITNASKVIVVTHSMGGLVARSYVQGWGLDVSGRSVTYAGDVARVITIDTPHQGSDLAGLDVELLPSFVYAWDYLCAMAATVNKSELSPGSSFLNAINNRPWPAGTNLDALVSYYLARFGPDTDGVVTRESQDVRTISEYWATHPSVAAHLEGFLIPRSGLHSAVLQSRAIASRVAGLVDDTDRESVLPPLPAPPAPAPPAPAPLLDVSGVWSGRWSSTDGEGPITLRLTQSGSMVTGSAELGTATGTFRGTLRPTGESGAPLQWTISYSYPLFGLPCAGTFGGLGTATSALLEGTYTGSDCHHSFSNGTFLAFRSSTGPPPSPGSSAKRFVVSPNSLYLSDFAPAGTDTYIGVTMLANQSRVTLTDIAVTPDGWTYAVSMSTLYTVDTTTAIVTPIGHATLPAINALTSDAAGHLWGASVQDGSLYRISRNDGSSMRVGQFGSGWRSSGDLAFDSSGTLWATVRQASDAFDTLVTVNVATGVATSRGTRLPAALYGLTLVNGTLYGLSSSTNSLYTISTTSGQATFVRRLTFAPNGTSQFER